MAMVGRGVGLGQMFHATFFDGCVARIASTSQCDAPLNTETLSVVSLVHNVHVSTSYPRKLPALVYTNIWAALPSSVATPFYFVFEQGDCSLPQVRLQQRDGVEVFGPLLPLLFLVARYWCLLTLVLVVAGSSVVEM